MRIISLSLILSSLLFAGCCKHMPDKNPTVNTCNCPSPGNSVDSSSVIGCWVLTDTGFYSIPLVLSLWIQVPGDSAVIRFNPDSSFCYNGNFPWSFARYSQFTQVGKNLWLVDLLDGLNTVSAEINLVGNDELILTRHGVDRGEREQYKRQ